MRLELVERPFDYIQLQRVGPRNRRFRGQRPLFLEVVGQPLTTEERDRLVAEARKRGFVPSTEEEALLRETIPRLQRAFNAWRAARSGSDEEPVVREAVDHISVLMEGEVLQVSSPSFHPERRAALAGAARRAVIETALVDVINREVADDARISLRSDLESGELRAECQPRMLRSFLWLRLGKAIADDNGFETCGHCGRLFELIPPGTRSTRKYCSDSCRTGAFRESKSERASSGPLEDLGPQTTAAGSRRQGDDEGAHVEGGPAVEVEQERKRGR